jgi:hypothetical protein
LPAAIYGTGLSDAYDLLHSALAIPAALALGLLALWLSNRASRLDAIRLGTTSKLARAGRLLGLLGLLLVASALVALGVYGLLEYAGSRD